MPHFYMVIFLINSYDIRLDIITKSSAELFTIQLSPDEPYFIRTSSHYRTGSISAYLQYSLMISMEAVHIREVRSKISVEPKPEVPRGHYA